MADTVLMLVTIIFSPDGSCLRIPGLLVPARPGSTRQPGPVAANEPDSGHGPGLRQHRGLTTDQMRDDVQHDVSVCQMSHPGCFLRIYLSKKSIPRPTAA